MTALSSSTIAKGVQLNGVYEIDEPLATGGMGEIYRAHGIQTGDVVAIKLIRADLAEDEAALALFRREASALNSIYHEAIVRYFLFSFDPTVRRHYLAMEFVAGEPLSKILRAGRLALSEVMALKQRVATGLQAAHEAGIVHRDIAPDNIMVRDRNFAKARIIDFGIARSTNPNEHSVIGGGFAGKYNYVSPEQLGLFGGDVRAQSDIYSFAMVLAYACRGERINMDGSHIEVIDKRRQIPDLSGVYPEIRPLIAWMLEPDPAMRPTSMREVADWRPGIEDEREERTQFKAHALHPSPSLPSVSRTPTAAPAPPPAAVKSDRTVAGLSGKGFQPRAFMALGAVVLAGLAGFSVWELSRRAGRPSGGRARPLLRQARRRRRPRPPSRDHRRRTFPRRARRPNQIVPNRCTHLSPGTISAAAP